MKLAIALGVVFISFGYAADDGLTMRGKVYVKGTKTPVVGAMISADPQDIKKPTTSGSPSGSYRLELTERAVRAKRVRVRVEKRGFKIWDDWKLSTDEIEINVELESISPQPGPAPSRPPAPEDRRLADLLNRFKSSDAKDQLNAALEIEKLGERARPVLQVLADALLGDTSVEARLVVLEILGRLGSPAQETVYDVAFALKDGSPKLRAAAAIVLGKFGSEYAKISQPELETALKADAETADVKLRCAEALLKIDSASAKVFGPVVAKILRSAQLTPEQAVLAWQLLRQYPDVALTNEIDGIIRARLDTDAKPEVLATVVTTLKALGSDVQNTAVEASLNTRRPEALVFRVGDRRRTWTSLLKHQSTWLCTSTVLKTILSQDRSPEEEEPFTQLLINRAATYCRADPDTDVEDSVMDALLSRPGSRGCTLIADRASSSPEVVSFVWRQLSERAGNTLDAPCGNSLGFAIGLAAERVRPGPYSDDYETLRDDAKRILLRLGPPGATGILSALKADFYETAWIAPVLIAVKPDTVSEITRIAAGVPAKSRDDCFTLVRVAYLLPRIPAGLTACGIMVEARDEFFNRLDLDVDAATLLLQQGGVGDSAIKELLQRGGDVTVQAVKRLWPKPRRGLIGFLPPAAAAPQSAITFVAQSLDTKDGYDFNDCFEYLASAGSNLVAAKSELVQLAKSDKLSPGWRGEVIGLLGNPAFASDADVARSLQQLAKDRDSDVRDAAKDALLKLNQARPSHN